MWPTALGTALVALLPKSGSGSADDYRPSVLLITLYRIWAKACGHFMQSHLLACGILKAAHFVAVEQQATDLAWRLLL